MPDIVETVNQTAVVGQRVNWTARRFRSLFIQILMSVQLKTPHFRIGSSRYLGLALEIRGAEVFRISSVPGVVEMCRRATLVGERFDVTAQRFR
ncbi:hypothetical protein GCT13_00270 [Paraburkholderia sp. CNPSo 3157]|uniref:Uncharacterized protein n=1 Tax=Paraburkholderia franconis TaxID=2654983 RepID=A0A7X1TDP1_9BURK|nr:hypothetical protein [Paraburkholderia franconis]MPW15387.1 hypothetical protein [Paraburkholderia franconis]